MAKRSLANQGFGGPVDSVEISNFRGFEQLRVSNLARMNLIVGDNGVGKTAFLEAVFLAVSGHTQKPMTLRQWRGMEIFIQAGSHDSVADNIYGDLFHDTESGEPIVIKTSGVGFENRQLIISRTQSTVMVPLEPIGNRQQRRAAKSGKQRLGMDQATYSPIAFTYTDELGEERTARVLVSGQGVSFEGTDEQLPNCFMFAAQIPTSTSEPAMQYSELQKRRDTGRFKKAFIDVFDGIADIQVGSEGPAPVLWADVPWAKRLLPLAAVSGGTNRVAAILLAITARQRGVVLIDEVESGVYHGRHKKYAEALKKLSEEYETQLIMTSHSAEWLDEFTSCLSSDDDVAFWRLERQSGDQNPTIKRFSLEQFRAGMAIGDMR